MVSISLCMIVKDEEDYIGACLESVHDLVDEIIIIDTGSSDNTEEIVSDYTDNIYHFKWTNDFSAARNYSFSKATKDFIFWLDADDVLLEEDRVKFRQLKEGLMIDTDMVIMKYNYGFDEKSVSAVSYYRERLIKKDLNVEWKEPIHEYIEVEGSVFASDICVTHVRKHSSGQRNLNIYRNIISSGETLSKRGTLYYAVELLNNNFYEESLMYFEKYLEKCIDYTTDTTWACYQMSQCYQKLGRHQDALKVLLESFKYKVPRAEICCEIGNIFIYINEHDKAIFWFELALLIEEPEEKWGFTLEDYWGFVPCIRLGICYYYLGDIEKAIYYNEEALKIKPEDSNALKNLRLFKTMQERSEEDEADDEIEEDSK